MPFLHADAVDIGADITRAFGVELADSDIELSRFLHIEVEIIVGLGRNGIDHADLLVVGEDVAGCALCHIDMGVGDGVAGLESAPSHKGCGCGKHLHVHSGLRNYGCGGAFLDTGDGLKPFVFGGEITFAQGCQL